MSDDLLKAFNTRSQDSTGQAITATDIGSKRGLDVVPRNTSDNPLYVAGSDYSILIDEPTAGVMYIGKAATGSATSAAVWQVKKLTESGTQTSILFADGSNEFTNTWDARASLTYI